jgi:hypothetical protein
MDLITVWDAIVLDFSNITEPAAFSAFLQVLLIDLVLAGDNAIERSLRGFLPISGARLS